MLRAVVLMAIVLAGSILKADDIPVGTSVFKLEPPKFETRTITSARYILGSDQELIGSCPNNAKLVSVGCDANTRSMGEKLGLNDWSERQYPVKGSIQEIGNVSTAKCSVPFVRAEDVVKVSMSLKCKDTQPNMAAK